VGEYYYQQNPDTGNPEFPEVPKIGSVEILSLSILLERL
jgi:hypothetical protein